MSESEAETMARRLGIALNSYQRALFAYLESRGLQFCVHFGTDNCHEVAAKLYGRTHREREWIL